MTNEEAAEEMTRIITGPIMRIIKEVIDKRIQLVLAEILREIDVKGVTND